MSEACSTTDVPTESESVVALPGNTPVLVVQYSIAEDKNNQLTNVSLKIQFHLLFSM